jgi:hypothetical protein
MPNVPIENMDVVGSSNVDNGGNSTPCTPRFMCDDTDCRLRARCDKLKLQGLYENGEKETHRCVIEWVYGRFNVYSVFNS